MLKPSPAGPVPTSRLARLGRLLARHPRSWVLAWVVVAVTCFAVAVGGVTGESLFERLHSGAPTVDSEASRAQDVIAESNPTLQTLTMQVSGVDLGDAKAVAVGAERTRAVAAVPGVKNVRSPLLAPGGPTDPSVAPLLRAGSPSGAPDGFVTVVDFRPDLDEQAQDAAEAATEKALLAVPDAMGGTGRLGSSDKVITAITSTVERDLLRGEGIALPLTFLVMVFVFGGFIAAGMPIIGAVVAIGGGLLSLFGFSHAVELDATVVNIVTLLGLGLSIDYGLLTVSRFREELAHRQHEVPTREEVAHATERTVATAGRTVLFSGLTVAIALAGLLTFEASIMRAIGVAGVSIVLVAMVVAITLVPALCVIGAKRLSRKAVERPSDVGLFSRLAHAVQRRPVLVIAAAVIVLVTLALPTLSMKLTSSGTELLPKGADQRVFFEDLARDYPALTAPEVTVVAASPDRNAVTAWADGFRTSPGVESVTVQPLGATHQRVDLRVAGGPTSDQAQDLVTAVRDSTAPFEALTTGQAAGQIDFLDSMSARAPYAVGLVVLGTFVLLFLMTGSVVVPLKALLLNLISLGAALGVVVWIFQEGHLEGLLGFSSVGAVESMVPFLVLAFGFGLSMDYEVFLLSRIVEFHRHGAVNDRAVSLGLQRTGRIITSAALLIVIVFAGFVAGDILIIKQMGVALVAAVAIDATLVRMLLVPATMTLLGRWNWWAPAPLRRVHDRFGITE